MLGSLALLVAYHRQPSATVLVRSSLFAGSLLCFVAALFSRENASLLPVIVMLYFLTVGAVDKNRLRHAIASAAPFVMLTAAFLAWRLAVVGLQGKPLFADWPVSPWLRVQVMFRTLATYGGLLVWPAHLQMERQIISGDNWLHVVTAIGVLTTLGFVVAMRWARRTCPLAFVRFGWFVLAILPMAGLLNLISSFAEHWLYLPSVGAYLAAGAAFVQARQHSGPVTKMKLE